MPPISAPSTEPFISGPIRDVIVRPLRKFTDKRGWLTEIFRHDELAEEYHPTMCYVSSTEPHVARGPHEHVDQADLFCFMGPSNFEMRLWDNRPACETYRHMMTVVAGVDNPSVVLVPKGIVHAYRNIGDVPGIVINCPNRMYMGTGRSEEVDEIRHEDDPNTVFRFDD